MDRFDFSPLFRSTIGFDRLTRMLDAATRVDSASLGYPPYNIEKTGNDAYRLTMAVAGFSPDELDVTVQENVLLVTGKAQKEEEKKNGGYLHRGIARRGFERRDASRYEDRETVFLRGISGLTHGVQIRRIGGAGASSALSER